MTRETTADPMLPASSTTGEVDLSLVVVNYNSAAYVENLLLSLRAQSLQVEGRPAVFEVVVIDNASRAEDHLKLASLRGAGVRLLWNTENLGYALANNQGFHVCRGRWHAVSNPDMELKPGCLQALVDTLEGIPGAAMVGPLCSMDPDGEVLMPPNELPDPYLESLSALSRVYPGVARYNMRRRAAMAWRYWSAQEPLRLPMLSGGFFLARRSCLLEHDLFDPGYPLYYEDTDLFRRYHQGGLELWHVPQARILHHFSRSALTRMKAALYRNEVGARRYFERWFGAPGLRTWERLRERSQIASASPLEEEILSPCHEPPLLKLPDLSDLYVEVAGNPQFTLAVGILSPGKGPFCVPRGFWGQLGPGTYWFRAARPPSHKTEKAWKVVKR